MDVVTYALFKKIKRYVDSSVSGGLPLGLTGATVGQTVKIKSVDEDGVPTEWEATGFDDVPTDDHINELISTALNEIGVAEEGVY